MIGADNRLLSDGTYWYSYDAEGNRTARYVDVDQSQSLTNGDTEVTEYTWDARNRLAKVTDYAKYGGDPTQAVDYLYDTENRWIGENIDRDGDGKIDSQTWFVYDGNQIVLQFDKAGTGAVTGADLSHRYLWQPDVVDQLIADEQITDVKEPGDVLWALGDHLGTVRDLAVYDEKADATTIANHRIYSSYGELASETNAAVDCLFGYTGKAFDSSAGLQHDGGQVYDVATGKRLGNDSRGFLSGSTNLSSLAARSTTTTAANQPSVVSAKIEASIHVIDVADVPTRMLTAETTWNEQEVLNLLNMRDHRLGNLWAKKGRILGDSAEHYFFIYPFTKWNWPYLKVELDDTNIYVGSVTAHVDPTWTSRQVAEFILAEAESNQKLQTAMDNESILFNDAAMTQRAGLLGQLQQTADQIAEVLKTGVKVGVGLTPGGLGALFIHNVAAGEFGAAIFEAVPLLPVKKIGQVALQVAVKGGGKITIPAPAVKVLYEMTPLEKTALKAKLAGKTADETQAILMKLARTQWGWIGSNSWKAAVKQVAAGGTHASVLGKVPTYEEAVQMIKAAGGTVVRVEGPHTGSPVAGHITFPHVNYYTATGAKGDLGIFALPAGG